MLRWFANVILFLGLSAAFPIASAAETPSAACHEELHAVASEVFKGLGGIDFTELCSGSVSAFDFDSAVTAIPKVIELDNLPDIGEFTFYGLAAFYNKAQVYLFHEDDVISLYGVDNGSFDGSDWISISGRFNALLLRAPDATYSVNEDRVTITWDAGASAVVEAVALNKGALQAVNPKWHNLKYAHLWDWMAALAKGVEWVLSTINRSTGGSWGLSILLLAILLKILLLPVGILTVNIQREISKKQAVLIPRLVAIKSEFKGEEAHERIMAAHKDLGISPFYALKQMIGTVIQVPILIAIFAALGEMSQLSGASFLWIDDFSVPDTIITLPFSVPGLGERLSILPFIMAGISAFSTVIFHDPYAPEIERNRQKRNLYLMAGAFFILFYPFPAAMVYFWMIANILQTIQQQILKL